MHSFNQISTLSILALGLVPPLLAAPVEPAASGPVLAARHLPETDDHWATYYNPSFGIGACGWQNYDWQLVAAIGPGVYDKMTFDGNPNDSKACGKKAIVTWGGKNVTVEIVDECPVCGLNAIDLSPAAFEKLASLDVGKLTGVSWNFTSTKP